MSERKRQIYTGDNLKIMRGMNSETVDLIYLDPPFNSGEDWASPIDKNLKFKDTWNLSDIHEEEMFLLKDDSKPNSKERKLYEMINAFSKVNGGSWKAYAIYMAVRLLEMERILKKTGSIYLHCDITMSHPLKLIMDCIFGVRNFRNEISWKRNRPTSAKSFSRNTDVILYYTKSDKFTWNSIKEDLDAPHPSYDKKDSKGAYFLQSCLTSPYNKKRSKLENWKGFLATPERGFELCEKTMNRLEAEGDLVYGDDGAPYRKWRWEGRNPGNIWTDITAAGYLKNEWCGYPTQKPLALLYRIIKSSSNPGDVVLDPFCGCATTLVAAETVSEKVNGHERSQHRQWIGIDMSNEAVNLVMKRLRDQSCVRESAIERFSEPPARTDIKDKIESAEAMKEWKEKLFVKQGGKCAYVRCTSRKRGDGTLRPEDLSVDHIRPRCQGGPDAKWNLQLLCKDCNSVKGNRGMLYLDKKKREERQREFDRMEEESTESWKSEFHKNK